MDLSSGLQQKCLRGGATWEAVGTKDLCCITVVARAPSLSILKLRSCDPNQLSLATSSASPKSCHWGWLAWDLKGNKQGCSETSWCLCLCVCSPASDRNQQTGATLEDERENKRFNARVCLSAETSMTASIRFHFPNILPKASVSNCASFLSVFVEVRDIYEVGFSLPSANLSEPTAPPPSGEVSQSRTAGKGGHVALQLCSWQHSVNGTTYFLSAASTFPCLQFTLLLIKVDKCVMNFQPAISKLLP